MGICDSKLNKKRRSQNAEKQTSSTSPKESTNQNLFHDYSDEVYNRISERTNVEDISLHIRLTNKFLGQGALGIVREGYLESSNEKVAVKTIWKIDIEDQKDLIKREIDITLDLDNEYVIKCYDIFENNEEINFVLEIVEGGDLFDHIISSKNKKLSDNESLDLLFQMFEAIDYLHNQMHVVHRDIKPENFLMYNEKGRNKVKLIDYGFAVRILPDDYMNDDLGTPLYTAPEIFLSQSYTSKVDVWSCGIVMYNMLLGKQPFAGSSFDDIKNQVLNKNVDYSLIDNEKLIHLLRHMLEKDPAKRYSISEALNELNSFKDSDLLNETIEMKFSPDIQKIMYILNHNKLLEDELGGIFLACLSLNQINSIYKQFTSSKAKQSCSECAGIVNQEILGKTYINIHYLIEYTQNINSKDFNSKINELYNKKGKDNVDRLIINVDKFLLTLIYSKQFILKKEVWNEFKEYDKNNLGFLTKSQCIEIFNDINKKSKIENLIYNSNEQIDFESFFNIYKKYEETEKNYMWINPLKSSKNINKKKINFNITNNINNNGILC